MTAPLLSVSNLEVRYGDLIGVADVSLEVPQGGIVALLGSNGAGKTTTLNAIAGFMHIEIGHRNILPACRSTGSIITWAAALRCLSPVVRRVVPPT